jgi:glycosyltransferase involved in cell wall biosynthesis
MRVAILGQFPTDLTTLGGVEVAIVYLMETLPMVGVDDVHIVSCRTELRGEQTRQVRGITVHYLPRQNQGRLTWHLRETRRMQALLRSLQPDIVHAHSTGLYAGAALGSGFPNVITAHGIVAREVELYRGTAMRLRGSIDAFYERRCLARAKDIIAISPYVQVAFEPLTRARFHLVENAVDYAFFRIAPHPGPERILFAGPVIARKGFLMLLKAMAVVKLALPHVGLHIAGSTSADPAYYGEVVRQVHELGLSGNVTFRGQLDQEHLLEEYTHCSVFVLPSLQETAPMAVQQAMAAAVPVVATPVGGVPALVQDGQTGLLVETGNSDALAEALLHLLQDDQLRKDMGQRARADATARFAPEIVARKTKAVYDEILTRARQQP